ncbi:MAG: carbon starvation protein A [Candidatus Omnitrophica bacterium]|nr:carbon starvation protein A [Candidatus Omnitrophota bacterium]
MNALLIAALALGGFGWGYRVYARVIERLLGIDPGRVPPSVGRYDGVDFVPAKNWLVLFGHHFASIAGAAPIIGPVIALSVWGWLPAFIWIVLGTVFLGAVHDFGALALSVQNQGRSVADISQDVISRRAKVVFSLFIFLALILVIAVFVFFCATTFVADPAIVLPSVGLIPVAVLVGMLLYRFRVKGITAEVIGIALLCVLLVLGPFFPVHLGTHGLKIWIVLLLIYAFVASITPVHILLQPRDYLSSFLLFAGLIIGYAGLVITHPRLVYPAYIQYKGDIGMLWPMLMVTVACGAISGFHSLIASGTTSKQLPSERYARRIGYGAMVAEGIVATLALIAVAGTFSGRGALQACFAGNGAGPVGAFGEGFGFLARPILGPYGKLAAMIILNSFILTTLDTATRITRYIAEELFHITNRFVSTFLIVLAAGWLTWSGQWKKIWPVFGASNQLVAALVLLVLSSWLLARKKQVLYTFIPGLLMLITAISALLLQMISFIRSGDVLLASINAALCITAFLMVGESARAIVRYRGRPI